MSSIKCPQCNLINFATAIACKRCAYFFQPVKNALQRTPHPLNSPVVSEGGSLGVGVSEPDLNSRSQTAAGSQMGAPENFAPTDVPLTRQNNPRTQPPTRIQRQADKQKSGMAIASMILGLLGCLFTSPIGLILGVMALIKANRRPKEYGGKGFAIAGVILNGLGILMMPILAAILIPNLMAARRAANEASAVATIRTLSAAEATYTASMNGRCGDIQSLIATRLVDVSLANSEKNGYRFAIVNLPDGGCEIHATPLSSSDGTLSFFFSTEDGVLRAAEKMGLSADINDRPIDRSFAPPRRQPEPAKIATQKTRP